MHSFSELVLHYCTVVHRQIIKSLSEVTMHAGETSLIRSNNTLRSFWTNKEMFIGVCKSLEKPLISLTPFHSLGLPARWHITNDCRKAHLVVVLPARCYRRKCTASKLNEMEVIQHICWTWVWYAVHWHRLNYLWPVMLCQRSEALLEYLLFPCLVNPCLLLWNIECTILGIVSFYCTRSDSRFLKPLWVLMYWNFHQVGRHCLLLHIMEMDSVFSVFLCTIRT